MRYNREVMKVIVGLGNPGPEYTGTRHNTGQLLVERISDRLLPTNKDGYGWRRKKNLLVAEFPGLTLVKSAGIFMNESGRMISDIRYLGGEKDLFIAHDDLDIRLGDYKVQFGVGPKVHGGINSIEATLKTDQFWRIRIGIDNRKVSVDGEAYVLEKFSPEEKEILDGVLEKVADEILKAAS